MVRLEAPVVAVPAVSRRHLEREPQLRARRWRAVVAASYRARDAHAASNLSQGTSGAHTILMAHATARHADSRKGPSEARAAATVGLSAQGAARVVPYSQKPPTARMPRAAHSVRRAASVSHPPRRVESRRACRRPSMRLIGLCARGRSSRGALVPPLLFKVCSHRRTIAHTRLQHRGSGGRRRSCALRKVAEGGRAAHRRGVSTLSTVDLRSLSREVVAPHVPSRAHSAAALHAACRRICGHAVIARAKATAGLSAEAQPASRES